jgi:hypothetical protein
MKASSLAFAVPIAALALLLAGCVTEYYPYQGGGPMIGQGGAAKRIDEIDIWQIGAPPRKFQIIGFIEDTRPGALLPWRKETRRSRRLQNSTAETEF